jgi:hypothetical protein
MEMLLMGACLSLFGLAVACLAFGAATRTEEPSAAQPRPAVAKAAAAAASPARFFVSPAIIPVAEHAQVPIEALLLQIESHVRLEQAAAESFLQTPTPALLHSKTISPLVN